MPTVTAGVTTGPYQFPAAGWKKSKNNVSFPFVVCTLVAALAGITSFGKGEATGMQVGSVVGTGLGHRTTMRGCGPHAVVPLGDGVSQGGGRTMHGEGQPEGVLPAVIGHTVGSGGGDTGGGEQAALEKHIGVAPGDGV